MDYLPPVGWADVATKRDLDALEERLGLRFDNADLRLDNVKSELRHEIADLRTSLMRQQLFLSFSLVGVLGTLMALINGIG